LLTSFGVFKQLIVAALHSFCSTSFRCQVSANFPIKWTFSNSSQWPGIIFGSWNCVFCWLILPWKLLLSCTNIPYLEPPGNWNIHLYFDSCLLDGLMHSPLSFSASLLVVISSGEFLVSLQSALSLSACLLEKDSLWN